MRNCWGKKPELLLILRGHSRFSQKKQQHLEELLLLNRGKSGHLYIRSTDPVIQAISCAKQQQAYCMDKLSCLREVCLK